MKKTFFTFIFFFFALTAFATINIDNVAFTIDTIARYQVGPGTWYSQVRLLRASDQKKRHDVYMLQVNRSNPYIQYQTILANDRLIGTEQPSQMAQRKTEPGKIYFAGTNGDFYNSGFRGFKSGVPDGTFITERTIAHTPLQGREPQPSAIFDSDNHFYFGRNLSTDVYVVRASGERTRCNHVNYDRQDDELVLYNYYNGATTLTETTDGTEVLCRINEGQSWTTNGTMTITVESVLMNSKATPLDPEHIVLSGVGANKAFVESLTVGEELTLDIHTWIHTEGITDASGTIVDYTDNYIPRYSGVYDQDSISVDFIGALGGQDKERFLINGVILETWAETHPRTAIGASRTGDTIIQVVVDGRGSSTGMTLGQMGQLMAYFGAWNAMNLEGGGSSAMYIRHCGVMNNPSDNGVERSESNGLFIVCDAPEDNVPARLEPHKPTFRLPKYGSARPQFRSYNQYGLMLSFDEQDLHLSCDPAVGYVLEDSVTFVALSSGTLTVRSGNAVYDIPVSVETDAQPYLRLDSILVDAWTNYPIELSAVVDDREMDILASALTWTFEPNQIAEVTNGVLNGLTNGVTTLQGAIGSFYDEMKVRVEISPSECLSVGVNVDTTISFSSVRNASITLICPKRLYSRPDTLLIHLMTNAPISQLETQVRALGTDQLHSYRTSVSVSYNTPSTLRIPLAADIFKRDAANYPLSLYQLKFTIKDPKKNTPYRLQLLGVDTKYRLWQGQTDLRPNSPSSILPSKCIKNGRLLIQRGSQTFTLQGQLTR